MENFIVEARLSTPLIREDDSWLTLDSLLAAAIYRSTDSVEQAHNNIPLEKTGELWHGSIAFPVDPRFSDEAFISSLSPHYGDYDLDTRKQVLRSGGLDGQRVDRRPLVECKEVVWFGRGNPIECRHLLNQLDGIGKKSSYGFGMIESITITPIDIDRSFILPDGSPARPIPVHYWDCNESNTQMSASDLVTDVTGYKPAYWDTAQHVMCVLPHIMSLASEQLERISGGFKGSIQPAPAPKNADSFFQTGVSFFSEHAGSKLMSRAIPSSTEKLAYHCAACGSTEGLQRWGGGYTTLCDTCGTFGGGYEDIKRPGRMGAGWLGFVDSSKTRLHTSVEYPKGKAPFLNLEGVEISTGKETLMEFLPKTLMDLPPPPFLIFSSSNSSVKVINGIRVTWSHRRVHIGGDKPFVVDAVKLKSLRDAWLKLNLPIAAVSKAVKARDNAKYLYSEKRRQAAMEEFETCCKDDENLRNFFISLPDDKSAEAGVLRNIMKLHL